MAGDVGGWSGGAHMKWWGVVASFSVGEHET